MVKTNPWLRRPASETADGAPALLSRFGRGLSRVDNPFFRPLVTRPAPSDGVILLHLADAEPEASVPQPVGPLIQEAGQPARDYRCRAIQIGKVYHAKDRTTGKAIELDVTPQRVRRWLDSFRRMKAKGVRVPYCLDHKVTAANTLGRVLDLQRAGDWLDIVFRAVGDDAIKTAARNEVSLGIKPGLQDGGGEVYPEAIEHLAATPVPVVYGQNGTILASRFIDEGPAVAPVRCGNPWLACV